MNDFFHRIVNWIDHNRYVVLAMVLSLFIVGCSFLQATTDSLIKTVEGNKPARVNQMQLEEEINQITVDLEARAIQLKTDSELWAKKIQSRRDDLFRNQTVIDEIVGAFKTAVGTAIPAQFTPIFNVIFGVLGTMGAGAIADNRRKNTQIVLRDEKIESLLQKK